MCKHCRIPLLQHAAKSACRLATRQIEWHGAAAHTCTWSHFSNAIQAECKEGRHRSVLRSRCVCDSCGDPPHPQTPPAAPHPHHEWTHSCPRSHQDSCGADWHDCGECFVWIQHSWSLPLSLWQVAQTHASTHCSADSHCIASQHIPYHARMRTHVRALLVPSGCLRTLVAFARLLCTPAPSPRACRTQAVAKSSGPGKMWQQKLMSSVFPCYAYPSQEIRSW